ncbi:hypothetical protein FGO68_gene1417 [Halteria grandinella]|uniref:Uncharacterized protein n=1 Tax=Halteria grandinella TaxID=5974 RepID=A0A8J8NHM1_HALGN|nr:hypothetical protein FGO68_gene1417 [Halteria grandinella]
MRVPSMMITFTSINKSNVSCAFAQIILNSTKNFQQFLLLIYGIDSDDQSLYSGASSTLNQSCVITQPLKPDEVSSSINFSLRYALPEA